MKKKILYLIALTVLASNTITAQYFEQITADFRKNSAGRTVGFVDVNDDDYLDIFIAYDKGQDDLYINNKNGGFESINWVSIRLGSVGGSWIDIDNDNDLDHYQSTWYGQKNYLVIDDGDGYSLSEMDNISQSSHSESIGWADYDNNGFLDIYIANSNQTINSLGLNFGSLEFKTRALGGTNGDSRCAVWADYNDDGYQDLLVTNEQRGSYFYKNVDGNLIRQENSLVESFTGFGASWGDFDNDGDLDLFFARFGLANVLLENLGNDQFIEVTGSGLGAKSSNSIGSAWGDIDNDGDLDLYVTKGYGGKVPNEFYINNGNKTFTEVEEDPTVEFSGWSYGTAFGDYDNDGFLDMLVANTTDNSDNSSLFRNIGNENSWIMIDLEGVVSNRYAIGARVTLYQSENNVASLQTREVASVSGYSGINDFKAHFGLGTNTDIDSILVKWPAGHVQKIIAPTSNQVLEVVEEIPVGFTQANFTFAGERFVGSEVSFQNISTIDDRFDVAYQWDFDGDGNIDSEVESPTYVYESDGNFEVSLTVSSTESSSTITRDISIEKALSIDLETSSIEIYPNPSNGTINISSEDIIEQITLFSITGEKIDFSYHLDGKKAVGHIQGSGTFILRTKTAKGKVTSKQIIVK